MTYRGADLIFTLLIGIAIVFLACLLICAGLGYHYTIERPHR